LGQAIYRRGDLYPDKRHGVVRQTQSILIHTLEKVKEDRVVVNTIKLFKSLMPRLHLTVSTSRNETWRLQKRNFKTQISCLLYEARFLPSSHTKYYVSLTTQKYFYTSLPFSTWLSNLHV